MITAGMAETTEKNMGQLESDILPIPNTMLEAAGIPPDSDLTVEEAMAAIEEGGYRNE